MATWTIQWNPARERYETFVQGRQRPQSFLQSYDLGEALRLRGRAFQRLLVCDRERVAAAATVLELPRYRLGRALWIMQGPVLAEDLTAAELTEVLRLLKAELLRPWRNLSLTMTPYVSAETWPELTEAMAAAGLIARPQAVDNTQINCMYVKDLQKFKDKDELIASLDANARRAYVNAAGLGLQVEDVAERRLAAFQKLLAGTAERKHFDMQDEAYFRSMRRAFGTRARCMALTLDVERYWAATAADLAEQQAALAALEAKGKAAEGRIQEYRNRVTAREKRLAEVEPYRGREERLLLAGLFCVDTRWETTTVFGARRADFIALNPSTVLNVALLVEALERGAERFNFYGVVEQDLAAAGQGNYKFKKNFEGEFWTLAGIFDAKKF